METIGIVLGKQQTGGKMLQLVLSWAMLLSHRCRAWSGSLRLLEHAIVRPPFLVLAVAAPAFFFLHGLDAFPLRDNNEGLYAEIAREMLAGGNWLIPHLNGVPYIEKPPLFYWLVAGSMAIFGDTAVGARLVSAWSFVALSLGLFAFAWRHLNFRTACIASIVFASMVPSALMAHIVLFDPLLTALLGGSLLCFLHGGLIRSVRWDWSASCLLGSALMEKGAVSLVLAMGIIGFFLLLTRDFGVVRWRISRGAVVLFFVLILPWHILAALKQQGFAWFYGNAD
jgi:4-amino-4-deoxy-L-arabinose transferase-like glycosyltransferase